MTIRDWLIKDKTCSTGKKGVLFLSVRLSRNLRGIPFPVKASGKDRAAVLKAVQKAAETVRDLSGNPLEGIPLPSLTENERQLLEEKGYMSRQLSPEYSVLYVSRDGRLTLLVNGENHIEIRGTGEDTGSVWKEAALLDSELSRELDYAFDTDFGYLTADPGSAGTGAHVEAKLFLPGLTAENALGEAVQKAAQSGFLLSGSYDERLGKFPYVTLTNRVTLGISEGMLSDRMYQLLDDMNRAEERAWSGYMKRNEMEIKDRIWRALGMLKYARLMSREETLDAAGLIACGVREDMLPDKDGSLSGRLREAASGAYVREVTHKDELDNKNENIWRAVVLRNMVEEAGL